ncbi:hypothetical protein [Acidiphilium acidophilum]|uniref:hypothetical protein n=1 Tax=Acidiphilium acidophilum TaxID=76588 RepID=UPI002E8E615E|nr:hypothetical protein [Acidiphilium acidophilum]
MLTQRPHSISRLPERPINPVGCAVLRRYLAIMAVGNLVWETAQLPLYTISRTGSVGYRVFAVLHCWIGDLVIGTITMLLGAGATGSSWPFVHVRRAIPVLPVIGTGLLPLLQWAVVPGFALLLAYRPVRSAVGTSR